MSIFINTVLSKIYLPLILCGQPLQSFVYIQASFLFSHGGSLYWDVHPSIDKDHQATYVICNDKALVDKIRQREISAPNFSEYLPYKKLISYHRCCQLQTMSFRFLRVTRALNNVFYIELDILVRRSFSITEH